MYEDDLRKYDQDNKEKASVIYKTIPEQLENHNSHFKFSLVDKNARYVNYMEAVNFVAESMIGVNVITLLHRKLQWKFMRTAAILNCIWEIQDCS